MKRRILFVLIIALLVSKPAVSQYQYANGVTTSIAIPVKTSPYFSKIGYSAGYFQEFFITERLSILSGASLVIFKIDRDYKLEDYFDWNVIDVIADLGPKFYHGIYYTCLKVGMIWAEQLEWAFMPQAGLWFEKLDIGLGYTHSKHYRYYEIKLNVYFD